jgi:hypothetical protein
MKLIAVLALAGTACACVPTAPYHLVAPVDPRIGTRTPRYVAVTAGVQNYDIVEPLDWREQNRRVAPGANPERGDSDDAARRGR